jgi:transcriptional regulator with XRE-family HTH domain
MNLDTNALVGAAIRAERDRLGITQDDLAQRLGMSRPSVANIEKGRQQISVSQLLSFSKALGVAAASLIPVDPDYDSLKPLTHEFPANATPQIMEWAEKLIAGRE